MEITVFAKRRNTSDNRPFYVYISRLIKKDGTEKTVSVKFKNDVPDPSNCPMNIVFDKKSANLSNKTLVDSESGEVFNIDTLWINEWLEGEPYEDHSLDDYE